MAWARAGRTLHTSPERSQRPCSRQGGCLGIASAARTQGGQVALSSRRQRRRAGSGRCGMVTGSVGLFPVPRTPAQMPNIHILSHIDDSSGTPKFRHSAGSNRGPGARVAGLDRRPGTAQRRISRPRCKRHFTRRQLSDHVVWLIEYMHLPGRWHIAAVLAARNFCGGERWGRWPA